MIYFTELDNLPIYDVRGRYVGRLTDMGIDPAQEPGRVAAYHVKTPKKGLLCITHEQMQSISVRSAQTRIPLDEIRGYCPDEGLICVKKDVLDQQIIDVNNRKVVRVNDVDFDIRPVNSHAELRLLDVNVGLSAAARRLLQGVMAKHTLRSISNLLPSKTIRWEFVNLIEPDPARRVKLRISYERLADLHPADIADILEELSRDEQKALIESLDHETAAQALSEIPTKMQAELLESIAPAKAADIVEEMPPDEAADLLQKLSPEVSAGVLAGMEKEDAEEVRELLGFEENTAGALMTTEFVVVNDRETVEAAIRALREYEGDLESLSVIYLVNSVGMLTGAVALAKILLSPGSAVLSDLETGPVTFAQSYADTTRVVTLFHKYNLLTLPVVDEKGRLLGVVTADDVLDLVVSRK